MATTQALAERLDRFAIQEELLRCVFSESRPNEAKRVVVAVRDLGVQYFDQLNHEKLIRRFVKRLTRFGHTVKLESAAASA